MNDKVKTSDSILTVTLETGETVLAKASMGELFPLRYGNKTQATKKLDSLSNVLTQNDKSASIIQVDGRFLILIYDAPVPFIDPDAVVMNKWVKEQKKNAMEIMAPSRSTRPPFATVHGERKTPRSRHNHQHKGQTDKPYSYWS